jgi:predicted PurR-regulated permease PerM
MPESGYDRFDTRTVLLGRTRIEYWFTLVWWLLIRFALIAGAIYFAYRVRFIIVTVILAALVAFAIEPLVHYLHTRRALHFIPGPSRRLLVTFFVFILVVAALVVLNIYVFTPMFHQVTQFLDRLPSYQAQLQARMAYLEAQYNKLPLDVREFLQAQDFSSISASISASLQHVLERTWRSTWRIVELILIPFLAFYFVLDSRSLKREFIFLVPRRRVREGLLILRETGEIMRHYIIGQAILAVIAGVVTGVGLHWLGVNFALALGVWSAVTRVIPVVGPVLGGIPVVLLATLQSWQIGMWVLVFFTLMHLFESKVLMPKILGYHMHLHPAIIIIVLLIGSEFFGLMGMFLAPPVAAIIKVLVNYYVIRPRTRRYGHLDERPGPKPPREDLEIEHTTVAAPGSHSRAD